MQKEKILSPEHLKDEPTVRLPAGKRLYTVGTPVKTCYYIRSGRLEASSTFEDGKRYILRYYEPGSFVLESAVITGSMPKWDLEAAELTELVPFTAETMREKMEKCAAFSAALSRCMAEKIAAYETQLFAIQTHSLVWRLCNLLVLFAGIYGTEEEGETVLDKKITQTTFASLMGVNRVSVVNTFRTLQKEGLVTCARNGSTHIRIKDLEELKKYQASIS